MGVKMKIATYNINSVKAHGADFIDWLKKVSPDIVFLQEIKCETENFLYFECESLGYKVAVLGQKSYNGVAILSKYSFELTSKNLPNFQNDDASRYIEVLVNNKGNKFYVASVYAPNGCSSDKNIETEKFKYKLEWFDKLYVHIKNIIESGMPIIIGGDFNVIMEDIDVYDSQKFIGSPLYNNDIHNKIKALEFMGVYDSFRILDKNNEGYTFWDYTGNSFVTNSGLRIDYVFTTAYFIEKLKKCYVDKTLREKNKPSDHTTLLAEFED